MIFHRFCNYVPELQQDSLGDHYVDSGEESEHILFPNEFDIDTGQGQWVRADYAKNLIPVEQEDLWEKMYKKKPGFYGNKSGADLEDEEVDSVSLLDETTEEKENTGWDT